MKCTTDNLLGLTASYPPLCKAMGRSLHYPLLNRICTIKEDVAQDGQFVMKASNEIVKKKTSC